VADNALMAAETPAHFEPRAQPVRRPVFGEGARFQRPADITKAPQYDVVALLARQLHLDGRAELERPRVDQRGAAAVAWAAEPCRRAGAAKTENRHWPQDVVLAALELGQ